MSRFSIENIIIEKSNKDIKTGIPYEFTEGINLICGNNEAGKSSLLTFLRQGFFKVKGVDKGKIYFKIDNLHFRVDIQDHRSMDLRCKIFDENNNPVNYDFIKDTVNQKYFEQGFTINLDDLMSIQNKDTDILIDTIKDPSGEKLNHLLEKIKLEAKKILGDNNRLTKETSEILSKINIENSKINELSNLETQYNASIHELKEVNEKLEKIYQQEEFLNILEKLHNFQQKLSDIIDQKSIICTEFNENLINNQEKYIKIIQNTGKIEANKTALKKFSEKISQLKSKISLDLNRLKCEFALSPKNEDIENFEINYKIIRQLKELFNKKQEIEQELIALEQNKENIEENLRRFSYELTPLASDKLKEEELEQLKKLYSFIDEHLTKFNYFQNKINDADKLRKINEGEILTSRNLMILFVLLLIMTVTIAFLCFYNNVTNAGIFAVLMSVFLIFGIAAMKISWYSNAQEVELKNFKELRYQTLALLKEQIKNYYSEIDNVESSYLPIKIENLKKEIQNKIQNCIRTNEIIAKNTSEISYNSEKLEIVKNKIKNLKTDIEQIKIDAENKITSVGNKIDIPVNIYIETVDIIKNIKENIKEIKVLTEEANELETENSNIINEFNHFITDTNLKLPFGDNYTENVQLLKIFNEKNLGFKNNIDILNTQIENINKQIKNLEEEKALCGELEKITREELFTLKQEEINHKKDIEFKKRNLEAFEGLNSLKIKKSVLVEEYRQKIFTLAKDKLILEITKTAKEQFDKILPDLKNAQKYLSILTDGKYTKINLDLEEIQSENGSLTKKWIELSRGTKEQVYLALRLGYASNYTVDRTTMNSNGKSNLPLIIDDAFVNFDENRTRQGIKCLIEFSKNNQVLFFTCHNRIMKNHFEELCTEAGASLNIVNIG